MRIDAILPKAALWLVAAAACALSGCPGELSNKSDFEAYAAAHGDAGAPTNEAGTNATSAGSAASAGSASTGACGDVVTRIFVPTCSGTGCHGATAPQQDLDLISPGLAARVVGVQAKQCLQLLVDPTNPEQSLMYQKLLTKPACGAQMPLARPALSSADITCVRDWIAAQ